jgi:hypothetical protein
VILERDGVEIGFSINGGDSGFRHSSRERTNRGEWRPHR